MFELIKRSLELDNFHSPGFSLQFPVLECAAVVSQKIVSLHSSQNLILQPCWEINQGFSEQASEHHGFSISLFGLMHPQQKPCACVLHCKKNSHKG